MLAVRPSVVRVKKPPTLKQRIAKAKADAIRVRFEGDCYEAGLPVPIPEYRFHPTRKWRFDYAWTIPPDNADDCPQEWRRPWPRC